MKNNTQHASSCYFKAVLLATLCLLLMGFTSLKDPTKPPDLIAPSVSTKHGALNLSGIFIYPQYQVAIIDGRRVHVGDQLGEYIVTAIGRNTVELAKSKKETLVLELIPTIKHKR